MIADDDMARREQKRRSSQRDGAEQHAAEKKAQTRQDRQCQRAEDAVFSEADRPNKAVQQHQDSVADQIERERLIRTKAEPGMRNIEDHQQKAAIAPDLLQNLDRFVVPHIRKAIVFISERKQKIRKHNDCHKG